MIGDYSMIELLDEIDRRSLSFVLAVHSKEKEFGGCNTHARWRAKKDLREVAKLLARTSEEAGVKEMFIEEIKKDD